MRPQYRLLVDFPSSHSNEPSYLLSVLLTIWTKHRAFSSSISLSIGPSIVSLSELSHQYRPLCHGVSRRSFATKCRLRNPSAGPPAVPSIVQSMRPSEAPTSYPSVLPSQRPSFVPSSNPRNCVTVSPWAAPSGPSAEVHARPNAGRSFDCAVDGSLCIPIGRSLR